MKRKSITKSVRFAVFARDGFTCKYCGRQSDEVKLVIDHIEPVSKGGTNTESNLITSCESCNQGKAAKIIPNQVANESHRLSLAQEFQEQNDIHKKEVEALKMAQELRQEVCNMYCEVFGVKQVLNSSLNHYVSLCNKFGSDLLTQWFQIARCKIQLSNEIDILRYIHGIKRRYLEDNP